MNLEMTRIDMNTRFLHHYGEHRRLLHGLECLTPFTISFEQLGILKHYGDHFLTGGY
jgi:hypothetical protein